MAGYFPESTAYRDTEGLAPEVLTEIVTLRKIDPDPPDDATQADITRAVAWEYDAHAWWRPGVRVAREQDGALITEERSEFAVPYTTSDEDNEGNAATVSTADLREDDEIVHNGQVYFIDGVQHPWGERGGHLFRVRTTRDRD